MQRLVILRHATAAAQGREPGDRARPLSEGGRREMQPVRAWMDENGVHPDAVICSTSLRTRETFDLLSLDPNIAQFVDALYLGTPETYLDEASVAGGETVLVIGHNPTCAALAYGFPVARASLRPASGDYPPASICVAEGSSERWKLTHLRLGGKRRSAQA